MLRFRLMVKRGPFARPQASEGKAQHEFSDPDGFLLATGRQPKLTAAKRLLEEGLATANLKVEHVFADENSTEFTVGEVVG